ncbi:MAG TPA: pilus assembly protein N-terminal domain-containing protein [Polyangiaceae bacterium]|nr:pilus assembly protein N-terminal domain-containing protein [Polyangiaceae bacterium]
MTRLRLCFACALLSCLSQEPRAEAQAQAAKRSANAEANQDINLAVGEARTISARDVKNYSEGVAGIVDVKLTSDASQFVLVGRKPGSTTLLLIKNDNAQSALNINVFARPPAVVEKELSSLLAGLNVQARRIGSQIVLDGAVASESDLRRVEHIAALYEGQVTSLVQLGQSGATPISNGQERFLIRIDFYFVQYDKNSSYGVGIGWPDSIGATATADFAYDFMSKSVRSATATLTGQPLPRLDIASRRGWAKVLKQATVITNNDAEANFSNGGEQNFPVNTGLTIGVQRIGFGTDVTVSPHYNPETHELALKLAADVSDLTAAVSGTVLPGRTTSKLTTNISLKLGQSLVLSGIRTQSLTHSVSGIPGLSEIPLIGLLFGSHSQSKLETEGAIFVVPSVIQTVPSDASELVTIALQKFKDYSGDVETVNAYNKNPGGGAGVPR